MYKIILASESPRRKEIMNTMGIPFESISADIEEIVEETSPDRMVTALAAKKVTAVAKKLKQDDELIIIGADTMVFCKGQALGKPKDREDAARMLGLLSDSSHEVYTGVHIIIRSNGFKEQSISFAVSTRVTVQPLTIAQIEDYISCGEPMDKAGAYAIQGAFGIHIREIAGDYYNVVGFPIARIYEKLLEQGINIKKSKKGIA